MKASVFGLLSAALLCHGASAQENPANRCRLEKNDAARLICYDMSATLGITPTPQAAPSQPSTPVVETPQPTATTKEIVATYSPADFKLVDPADLAVAPNKYMGKPISVKGARCFYADRDEYRCLLPGNQVVMLLAATLEPAAARAAVEDECGAIKVAMSSAKCRKTVRFVPTLANEDLLNGYTKRIVVGTRSAEIVAEESRSRR